MPGVDEPIPAAPEPQPGVPGSPAAEPAQSAPSTPDSPPQFSPESAAGEPVPGGSAPGPFPPAAAAVPPDVAGSDQPMPSEPSTAPGEKPPGKRQSATRQAVEWVVFIAVALGIALLIKTFLFQAFFIPSESMVPTLKVHDRVLVNKLSYKMHPIHRGDIVVFTRPPNEPSDIKDLVKRVIGLPGETIEGRNGQVYINGRLLEEPYLPRGTITPTFSPVIIPANSIWVMGDNRQNSADSHVFGPIRESSIVGRVFLRIWPLSRIGFL
jgi:signal peptidase I